MERVEPRRLPLVASHQSSSPLRERERTADLLALPISVLKNTDLVIVPSTLCISAMLAVSANSDSSIFLIQDSPDTIEGVVTRERIDELCQDEFDGVMDMSI